MMRSWSISRLILALTGVLLASTSLASASPFAVIDRSQQPLRAAEEGHDRSVPGDNPLRYCPADGSEEFIVIEHVNLTPNPPQAGHNLTIEAAGVVKKPIAKGAYVRLQVKWGLIRLLQTTADLCDQFKAVDVDCPVQPGETKLTHDVQLPKEIPPGTYTVDADVYSVDNQHIVCLTSQVTFDLF